MESLDSLSCPIEEKEVLHPNLLCINFLTLMILLALVILVGLTLSSWLGIGLSSGEVLSGATSSQGKNGYPFIRRNFKATYSLKMMASSGELVISKDVYPSIENFLYAEPLRSREIKQRTGPWENLCLQHRIERRSRG